ncbi:hypothetical protein T484DRAFT_1769011 [Baffinella frigidus]|nr:hypothetical protein T484DRAFT_1769011 [Cryptophyta sp. CCMP2293]
MVLAIEAGHAHVFKALLKEGSYIEQSLVYRTANARNGWRPLGIAAAGGSTEVVQLLLDAKATVDGVLSP